MSADGGAGGRRSWRRAFGWGVLFIGDATADGVAVTLMSLPRRGRWMKPSAVVVRHGQDVDGDGVVAVPTGVLTNGDADEEERFDIEPGLWRVQIALSPLQDAETVTIWLNPAGQRASVAEQPDIHAG